MRFVASSQSMPWKHVQSHVKAEYAPARPGNVKWVHASIVSGSPMASWRFWGLIGVARTVSVASAPMRWLRTMSAHTAIPASCRASMAARYSSFVPYFVGTELLWSNSPRSYRS